MQLRIVTPTGEVLNTEIDQLTASGLLGEFGVLPGHIPFMSALKIGPASYKDKGLLIHYALGEGFAEVYSDQVTLFVETAEASDSIDVSRAQQALARAEKRLTEFKGNLDSADPKLVRAQKAHSRAQSRIFVAKQKSN